MHSTVLAGNRNDQSVFLSETHEAGLLKTALFTCELREDLGFAAPLLCIADELVRLATKDGIQLRTVFALSDPVYCGHEVASHGHVVLPAPLARRPLEINSLGKSYANLLAAIGFGHERELRLIVDTWDRLFAVLSPAVVVTDNSPVACLAARGRIPLFVTGSGFRAPPADIIAFPPIANAVESETNQILIRDVVNRILQSRGLRRIGNLPELFAGDGRAVFTVPQLDPYAACRNERLLEPCLNIKGPLAQVETPSVFVALPSTFSHLARIVRALERVGATISCYVPGPRSVGLTLLNEIGAHIFEARPLLNDVLSNAAVVLAASADVALSAYLAGRPQVLFRSDLETSIMASELEKRHAAIALEVTDAEKVTDAIRELMHNPSYDQSAREEARRVQAILASANPATLAATGCLELIKSHCSPSLAKNH
jgi:UDP:flavonoid glycosyltransferase YjiC (YdhE family)